MPPDVKMPPAGLGDLFDNAPCGYLSADPDRRIVAVNATLLGWLGYQRVDLIGKEFTELLTVGGRIHYETHFAPLLQMNHEISGVAVDLVTADGKRLSVLFSANVSTDEAGRPIWLRVTFHDARDRRSYERELLEARERAEQESNRARLLVRTLQRSLLPPSLSPPEGLEAGAYYHAASANDLGGDFYDLFPLSHDRWGFFLGDVCGKGADAAAITSLTRYTLRAAAVFNDEPVAVLHNLDVVLHSELSGEGKPFCTVVFGVLSLREEGFDVVLASGGHPPPILLRSDGQAEQVDTSGGQAAGMFSEAHFVSTRVRLEAGDTLLLYTDGLTEARTGLGPQRYDDNGALLQLAEEQAPSTAADIVDVIRSLLERLAEGVDDDAAVLALGVPPVR
jgi:sigma-B regulation protein RsbU (phosphoserine phosphatase)